MENVIIFEGQDRCLKSTMIERLTRNSSYNYHTLHYGKPPLHDAQNHQEKTFKEMFDIIKSDKSFILDRSHIGEMIWAPLYRNYDAKKFIQKIEKEWYDNEYKNVHLFVIVDSNFQKWKERNDSNGLNDNEDGVKHYNEIEIFKKSLNYTCILNKHFIDLSLWYVEDSNRIKDAELFDFIIKKIN